jgi:uncharacterized membrane protein YeaQ/YmgE (transglycosylase-associated protein family)
MNKYIYFIPIDKQLHFFYGFFFTMFGQIWLPFICLGIVANLIKELTDENKDWMDFVAGIIGSIFGAFFVLNFLINI